VVEHADGVVVFDTGQDRASVTDPCYFPGGPLSCWCRPGSGGPCTARCPRRGLLRGHIDRPGLRWSPVDFTPVDGLPGAEALRPFTTGHDLFGDGSLVLLPTPGHTSGSVSLFVRRADGPPILLVGDLTYDVHGFEGGVDGGVGRRRDLRRTRNAVLGLRANHPGMLILAAHDPAAAPLLEAG